MGSCLEKGLALIRQGGQSTYLINGLLDLAALRLARADPTGALETLAAAEREFKDMDPAIVQAETMPIKLRCQAAQGDLSGLALWLESADLRLEQKMDAGRFTLLCLAASFLLKLDRTEEARQILDCLEEIGERSGDVGLWILPLIQQALAWEKEGETDRALTVLEKALALAGPEGHLRAFLDEGPEMQGLLRLAHQRGLQPDLTARLLSAFAAGPGGKTAAPSPARPALLSRRELELLGLIASGCSNKDIAGRLVISLGTVKRHTVNIFNKLDVKNRTEAVARARELKLL
jgi:LuxR family maltose regulon positive regulatory protein